MNLEIIIIILLAILIIVSIINLFKKNKPDNTELIKELGNLKIILLKI